MSYPKAKLVAEASLSRTKTAEETCDDTSAGAGKTLRICNAGEDVETPLQWR